MPQATAIGALVVAPVASEQLQCWVLIAQADQVVLDLLAVQLAVVDGDKPVKLPVFLAQGAGDTDADVVGGRWSCGTFRLLGIKRGEYVELG
jgi:hypothetical protein